MIAEIVKQGLQDWGIECSDLALQRIERFAYHLLEKNKVMNLTSITEPRAVAIRHMLDCLYLLSVVEISHKSCIDIGCGAGFPGIPLLLARPDAQMTMLDSTAKRIAFIKEVLDDQKLKASLVAGRAEEYVQKDTVRESYDIGLSRAVAPLNILCELVLPYVKPGGLFLPMKTANALSDEEVVTARSAINELGGTVEAIHDYDLPDGESRHRLIVIRKIKSSPDGYPRRFAKITASPL